MARRRRIFSSSKRYTRATVQSPSALHIRRRFRRPRFRISERVSVAQLVGSPEDQPSRPNVRLRVVGLVVMVLFTVLIFRLYSLQVLNEKTYAAAVNANQIRTVTVPAPRGLIVDRNDTKLVDDRVEEDIVLSQTEAAQHPGVIGQVAALVGETPAQIKAALKDPQFSPYEPVPVLENATPDIVDYLIEHQSSFPGVSVIQDTERTYPQGGNVAAHLLGYVSPITGAELAAHPNAGYSESSQYGSWGVEQEYEKYLRGVAGTQKLEVNYLGDVEGTLSKINPKPGDTVVLNLDLGLQQEVESALNYQITYDRSHVDPRSNVKPPAPNGAVVVLDPQNGQVLAMASYPSYNLNEWVGGISEANYQALNSPKSNYPLNNYAISGLYTPGSTFKLVTATAALQKAIITPESYVDDTGTFTVPGCQAGSQCVFHDDEASDAGEVDLVSALTESDDYYFYNLGALFWDNRQVYGSEPIQQVAGEYGLGDLTGIDLPNAEQSTGRVDSPTVRYELHKAYPAAYPYDTWYTGDNVEMAFGQGETVVTPLSMATAYATFANGGTRYAPQVASAIVSPDGKLIKQFAPRVEGHVALPPAIDSPILQGLEGVIDNPKGTGNSAFAGFKAFAVAGKTGTASNAAGLEPNSWFVAFGPLPNPQYVVLCVIAQGGYGADAAAPVVRQVFDYLATNPITPAKVPLSTSTLSDTPPKANPPAPGPVTTSTTTTTAPGTGPATTTTAPPA